MKKLLLFLILLGMVWGVECGGDIRPNLGVDLILNCSAENLSKCKGMVLDNNSILDVIPGKDIFGEEQYITTTANGKFFMNIFLNDKKYSEGKEYTAKIFCIHEDNVSEEGEFNFTVEGYPPMNWVGSLVKFLKDNIAYLGVAFLILLIILAFVFFMLKHAF